MLQENPHNQTLLEAAFEANYTSFVKKVFDAGEDVNAKNASDKTLLHRAAETGRLEMVEALLKVPGIDIHAKDKDKWGGTPLHKDFFIYLQG